MALNSGFPDAVVRLTGADRTQWLESYLEQLLTRDAAELAGRDRPGRREVDLLAELAAHHVVALEVKATAAPRPADARHLAWLRDQIGDRFIAGAILHTGPGRFALGDRILALPIATMWAG